MQQQSLVRNDSFYIPHSRKCIVFPPQGMLRDCPLDRWHRSECMHSHRILLDASFPNIVIVVVVFVPCCCFVDPGHQFRRDEFFKVSVFTIIICLRYRIFKLTFGFTFQNKCMLCCRLASTYPSSRDGFRSITSMDSCVYYILCNWHPRHRRRSHRHRHSQCHSLPS